MLVLLDLKLPKVDGLQVLKQIKSEPRTKAIPVILLTSSKEESDMATGYRLGVNSYIQKPVHFGEFQEVVRQLGMYWLLVNSQAAGGGVPKRLRSQTFHGRHALRTRDMRPAARPLRILIAEDNPADLELTVRELRKSGYGRGN